LTPHHLTLYPKHAMVAVKSTVPILAFVVANDSMTF